MNTLGPGMNTLNTGMNTLNTGMSPLNTGINTGINTGMIGTNNMLASNLNTNMMGANMVGNNMMMNANLVNNTPQMMNTSPQLSMNNSLPLNANAVNVNSQLGVPQQTTSIPTSTSSPGIDVGLPSIELSGVSGAESPSSVASPRSLGAVTDSANAADSQADDQSSEASEATSGGGASASSPPTKGVWLSGGRSRSENTSLRKAPHSGGEESDASNTTTSTATTSTATTASAPAATTTLTTSSEPPAIQRAASSNSVPARPKRSLVDTSGSSNRDPDEINLLQQSLELVWRRKSVPIMGEWKKASPANYHYKKLTKQKEFDTFERCLRLLFDWPEKLRIDEVFKVYNPQCVLDFNSYRKKIEQRQRENPALFKKTDWEGSKQVETKRAVIDRYDNYAKSFVWNHPTRHTDELPIIPVVHGTDYEVAKHICNTGFTTVASLDSGYYGQGMYFSTSISYTIPYFVGKKTPCILLCFAMPGNVFPVSECPKGDAATALLGKPVKSGYHCHYVSTNKSGLIYNPETDRGCYDEVVLFQECQVVPAYMITAQKKGLHKLATEWARDSVPS